MGEMREESLKMPIALAQKRETLQGYEGAQYTVHAATDVPI